VSKYYVLVAGNGKSSRENIEALIDDYLYSKGDAGVVVLAFDKEPSIGQIYAAQFAKDKNKDIVIFCSTGASTTSLPSASISEREDFLTSTIDFLKGEDSTAFLLWDDTDDASAEALKALTDVGITCMDLTNGLLPLEVVEGAPTFEVPEMPQQEMLLDVEVEEEDDEVEEDEDEEGEENEEMENFLYEAVYPFADVLADAFAEALIERLSAVFVMKESE
jgi:hypothetical protein